MLLDDEGDLVVVCRAGNASGAPIELGGGIASRVARDREPLLVQGTVSEKGHQETESAVCVPLMHRGQVLGVINLIGAAGHTYSEYDLRAVSLFAEHAAIAVANARLYEAERALSAQLSHQVVHDPLTGAANRVLISDRLGPRPRPRAAPREPGGRAVHRRRQLQAGERRARPRDRRLRPHRHRTAPVGVRPAL